MQNRQVAHIWAQQNKSKGGASNFFFEGETIYSYGHHFAIAKFARDVSGKNCVLFTTRGYSVSTSKHINYVRQALHGLNHDIYNVNDPSRAPSIDDAETLKKRAIESAVQAGRARVAVKKSY